MSRNRTRRTILLLIGGASAWSLAASAQQRTLKKRIGVMISRPQKDPEAEAYVAAFKQGLEQSGWVPGVNIAVEYRWTGGSISLSQVFAKELVALKPDVLVINSTGPLHATKQIAGSIPIVMASPC